MDKFKAKQQELKRTRDRLSKYLNESTANKIVAEEVIKRVVTLEEDAKKLHNEAIEKISNQEEFPSIESEHDEFLDSIFELQMKAKTLLENNGKPENVDNSMNIGARPQLPKIEIPKFNGNSLEWLNFKDLFNSLVNSNASLSGSQKLHFLKISLQGVALQVIQSLQTSDSNFQIAWDLLTERFDHPRDLITAQLRRFFEHSTVQLNSASSLQSLVDCIQEVLRTLEALNRHNDLGNDLATYLVLSKLDNQSRRAWELDQKDKSPAQLDTLLTFLRKRSHALCSLESTSVSTSLSDKTATKFNSRNFQHKTVKRTYHVEISEPNCPACNEKHFLFKCKQFLKLSVAERRKLTKEAKLCFNCLKEGHESRVCTSRSCKECNQRHHTLVHSPTARNSVPQGVSVGGNRTDYKAFTSSNRVQEEPGSSTTQLASTTHNAIVANQGLNSAVLLNTAIVFIKDKYEQAQPCRALLDNASESSFVTEELVQRLGLPKRSADVTISGIAGVSAGKSHTQVQLQITSNFDRSLNMIVDAIMLPRLTGLQPSTFVDDSKWKQLRNLPLADPYYNKPGQIDLLLGADVHPYLVVGNRIFSNPEEPVATLTAFGYTLSGRVSITGRRTTESITVNHASVSVDELLEKFWKLDECPEINKWTEEELKAEEHFKATHTREESGRYVVKLPVKGEVYNLGNSYPMARRRLAFLEAKLENNIDLAHEYRAVMSEYEVLHHMEEITEPINDLVVDKPVYYMPHHAVRKVTSTTTPTRVVFDASARSSNGLSLNDNLLVGPRTQPELFDILLRFRTKPIALTADCKQMYRCIKVASEDRDLQRILWRNSPFEPTKIYRLTRVTFGVRPAPFLATRCLVQLAEDEGSHFPKAKEAVLQDCYMDDCITGADSCEEAQTLRQELIALMDRGKFTLQKWTSNRPEILQDIAQVSNIFEDSHQFDPDSFVKILGVRWTPSSDEISFKVDVPGMEKQMTKRKLLSCLAKIFDPFGLINPITTFLKFLVQELWTLKLDWDDPLPSSLNCKWELLRTQLHHLENLRVKRFVGNTRKDQIELHGFADASTKGYCAVIYLKCIYPEGVEVNLLAARSRVAPLKTISVPRLELCGTLLLAKLLNAVGKILNIPEERYHAWTDSSVALSWINSSPSAWTTFVANRVSKIHELLPITCWHHVPGINNPADLGSRGMLPIALVSSTLWWSGPDFLCQKEINFEVLEPNDPILNIEERKVRTTVHTQQISVHEPEMALELLQKWSKWGKIQRITAYILRFVSNCGAHSEPRFSGPLNSVELDRALDWHIAAVQGTAFSEEIRACLTTKIVSPKSKLLNLDIFLDNKEILRVGGRLQNSNLPYRSKHPAVLPSKHMLVDRLFDYLHHRYLHAGPQLLLAMSRRFVWTLRGKDAAKSAVRRCLDCFKLQGSVNSQLMGSLPTDRVTAGRPFQKTAVDFCGPFTLKSFRGRNIISYKGYVSVFVCLFSKAVHLELVTGMSSDDFLACLRRFTSRRGLCSDLFSDNGTNFVGAHRELRRLLHKAQFDNPSLHNELAVDGITWHFCAPANPEANGLCEAAVKSTKYHLTRLMQNDLWTFEEFSTALCQIEAILNSRPLQPLSSDLEDLSILTPAHFLVGGPLQVIPEPDLNFTTINSLKRYQLIQRRIQHFWRQWSHGYLQHLQTRAKWKRRQSNVAVGDLVVLHQDNIPPCKWSLARVIEVHPGKDGLVRVVTVRTASGILKRPVTKLSVLN